ncbi:hypothetical protein [Helicobacter bilis]|uniref:Uncharacterized protein n=1 Tax=Helicobacter bilis TaxID=37372 RepID=A0A4U8U916_9HELI|nr:hypothetical protein [Helicobacter bilis]MCI7410654.1 hypothetical protein [Helicobacter bilis]MDD7295692.1 hypothetical protein [Helicobacter bilis]MDY4400135.1 hypothetical protein [Helicobacter bilis]TLE10664.1 hypothetical protein LS79_005205 [Helicobacter bilis]
MRKLFILAFCCMSIVYAGLKEDIEEKFNECVKASNEYMSEECYSGGVGCEGFVDEYDNFKVQRVYKYKEYCFMEFSKKYEDILMRQCENKKKDECKKLAHIVVNVYGVDPNEHSHNIESAINNLLTLCSSTECYEIAELFGLTHTISQPFLEKACKENVDDACYAIGK